MKRILAPILLLVFLFPSLALSEEVVDYDDLAETDGIFYKKFTDVPFTGKVTGIVESTLINGKWHGSWVTYWSNGQVLAKGNFKNRKKEGPWVYYWGDGQLERKGDYKNDEREGSWVTYNKDGTVNEFYTGTYKNGVKVD